MRIQSKFQDYYDSAQGYGQDLTRVYVRETSEPGVDLQEVSAHYLHPLYAVLTALVPRSWSRRVPKERDLCVRVTGVVILFAGKMYPLAQVVRYRELDNHVYPPRVEELACRFAYSAQELERLLQQELGADLGMSDELSKRRRVVSGHASQQPEKAMWRSFLSPQNPASLYDLALELQVPCAVLRQGRPNALVLNPQLSSYQLYRVLGAEQAYQELAMFFGNLAMPEGNTVAIEDKYRIAQHGFDRMSFRKGPELTRAQRKSAT